MCMTVTKRLLYQKTCHTVCVVKGAYVCNNRNRDSLGYNSSKQENVEEVKERHFQCIFMYVSSDT